MIDLRVAFWLALDYADAYLLRHRWYSVCQYVSARLYNAEEAAKGSTSRIINGTFTDIA